MTQQNQDVTEAEQALLQALWDSGPATIRQLVERVYKQTGTSVYATVQKLLDRWKAEQNRVPNGLPYDQYQYDMVWLTKALYEYLDKKSMPATGDTLKEALLTVKEFELPMTGKMVIDGHRVNKPVYLLTVEKGVFVPLATLT